ncbi:MAG: mechanosensitive ion channel family protein [Terriglobia bacterium]
MVFWHMARELLSTLVTPFLVIVGSLLAGMAVEALLLRRLRRIGAAKNLRWLRALAEVLDGPVVVWFVLAGVYLAMVIMPTLSDPLRVLAEKILIVVALISATVFLSSVAVRLAGVYSGQVENILPSTSIFSNILRVLVFALGFLVILGYLGISITPVLTALGVGGLAVALALQDTLSNLFAGLHILAAKQIRPGDYIRLSTGEEGYVIDVNWRNTTIEGLSTNMVVIPNSRLATDIVTNFYLPQKELQFLVEVGVDYGSDFERVEQITKEVAVEVMKTVEGGVASFEPKVSFVAFAESSINFRVSLRADEFRGQFRIKSEFTKRLQTRFRKEGIDIPFPQRTVHVEKDI